ncbi:Crp/Fnr family transcriptional regulator [Paenibacillus zanthoxyli]|uniref:Crp/Fnr family transcriptional regulator n=1 Tax=Paenibacillus zanthoxyli TaxID=369399 RepID=UPI0004AF14D0|nr:Crp/Fnr family transcriptional regulator [Paenibacillus zanthoxyli]
MLKHRYAWRPFLKYGQLIKLKKNTVIFNQGDIGNGFYYLDAGSIKKTIFADNGDERIIYNIADGMLFGEDGMNREPYLANAVATMDCTLYHFSKQDFLAACTDDPNAAIIFTGSLMYKLRLLAQTIKFMDSTVETKLAHYLLRLKAEVDGVPVDQTTIANSLGTSRVTINKVLNKWKKEGVIEVSNRMICILDSDRMKQLAQ